MIKILDIINFQAHKESHFEFVPGINAITGASDQGKSSVIRALKWLILNRPGGEDFKNYEAGKKDPVAVQIVTDDNLTISLERMNGTNTYMIADDVEAIEYQALRRDVPTEVQDAISIPEDSIQMQHDPFFLIQGISPGDVAQKLNDLVGLSIIDTLYENLNKKIRGFTSKINEYRLQRDELEIRLEKFKGIEQAEKIIAKIEKKEGVAAETDATIEELKKYKRILIEIDSQLEKYRPLTNAEELLNKILDKIKQKEEIDKKYRSLYQLSVSFHEIEEDEEYHQAWLEPEKDLNKIMELVGQLKETDDKAVSLRSHRRKLQSLQEEHNLKITIIADEIKQYLELLQEDMRCPTCYAAIDKTIITKISEELQK